MSSRRWLYLLFSSVIGLSITVLIFRLPVAAQERPSANSKISADLLEHLAEADELDRIRVIIHFSGKTELPSITKHTSEISHRNAIITQLQKTAVSNQKALINELEAWQREGQISTYQPFWIVNAIAMSGLPAIIRQIATRSEISAIALDVPERYFDPPAESINLEIARTLSETMAYDALTAVRSWGIERVHAPEVWNGLGVDGDGITVAIMDSGVDWLHPDLYPNYRGNQGGVIDHSGNWYHTSTPTITEPVDLLGHGTHVAGTAVGQNGLGVAPGAEWIAVSIADENGFIYESDVHAGFEWLLAPDGDPALAPDIVNNSWSGNPYDEKFVADIDVLQAAGIINVFAAGNSGPFPGSVGSPASYTNTIAVAASDDIDEIAWFSARGPSPLTSATKPWIAAPGTEIFSALPGGQYGYYNGTSMATPHVAGAMALLLSANPSLKRHELADILAATAVPLDSIHPNDNSGWGLLNAYAAVSSQAESGILRGKIFGEDGPLPDVSIIITTTQGNNLRFTTGEDGRYQATLQLGTYDMVATTFGFQAESITGLDVVPDVTTTHHITLTRLPGATISGYVRETGTNEPLQAEISVIGTPVKVNSDENGRYEFRLPEGQFKLIARADNYNLERAVIYSLANGAISQDFILEPAPTILLIDGGKWYYDSHAAYYRDSLNALNRNHDVWTIRNPFSDAPDLEDLTSYDHIIWSNPLDSPGYIGAGEVISQYLGLGGNMLVSGQHVGSYDGQGFDTQYWWYRHLGANYWGKAAATEPLTGAEDSIFAGLSLALNNEDSAQNQTEPDQSSPRPNSLTEPSFLFPNGRTGGLLADRCKPFRIAYFGFGLEGVSPLERADILHRSLTAFEAPRITTGVQWEPDKVDDFALAGEQLVYTLTIRNMSESLTDTFRLSISGNEWAAGLVTKTLTLGSCQTGVTRLTIDVPAGETPDSYHQLKIAAVSNNDSAYSAELAIQHKTPGQVLLVDDDRWYNQEAAYKAMLEKMALSYDVWDIGWDNNKRGSPPPALLNAFDFVIWYTAYDWFAPVTAVEREALTQYMAQGGRLLLTSQDFLYYHHQSALAREVLGIIEYREMVTPTMIYGAGNPLLPAELAGPLPLDYPPYQNNSDGVIPSPASEPFVWSDRGSSAGIKADNGQYRAVFLSFPLEKLPEDARDGLMNSALGWLSDLGESTFMADQRTTTIGEARTFTITLRNLAAASTNQVTITNTMPAGLSLIAGSITGDAFFEAADNQLRWTGTLTPGDEHVITYQVTANPGLAPGSQLDNDLQIHYGRHNLTLDRTATLWANAPDLSESTFTAVTNAPATNPTITYTLRLVNSGRQIATGIKALIQFSEPLMPLIPSLVVSEGDVRLDGERITWRGKLAPDEAATITLALARAPSMDHQWLPATAVIEDNVSAPVLLYNQIHVRTFTHYFPLIAK